VLGVKRCDTTNLFWFTSAPFNLVFTLFPVFKPSGTRHVHHFRIFTTSLRKPPINSVINTRTPCHVVKMEREKRIRILILPQYYSRLHKTCHPGVPRLQQSTLCALCQRRLRYKQNAEISCRPCSSAPSVAS